MSGFAFSISFPDIIRKLGARYVEPVDFVHNFVASLYRPGARLDFVMTEAGLELSSDRTIEDRLFEDVQGGAGLAISSVTPPVNDYLTLDVASGTNTLSIDPERNITV